MQEWKWLLLTYTEPGARYRFEEICKSYFKSVYSHKNVKGVRVVKGDGGVDISIGDIGNEPITVIQCKFFISEINNSQKDQIRKSFEKAVTSSKYTCATWVLCIPIELSLKEHEWWGAWKAKQEKKYDLADNYIRLFDGADLIEGLKKEKLYETYFSRSFNVKDVFLKQQYLYNDKLIERKIEALSRVETTQIKLREIFINNKNEGIRIALLGVAGYGKSIELQQLAGYHSREESSYYPFLFFLRDYNGGSISVWLSETVGMSWESIEENKILLILDGLDEINDGYFQVFINSLNSFITQKPKINVVLSSRFNFIAPNEYSQIRGFNYYVLNKLTGEEVDLYLKSNLKNKKDCFINEIEQLTFEHVLENPFYLSKLVNIYLEINRGNRSNFPTTKGELLKEILFEQLKIEETRYRGNEIVDTLYPIAKKLAFCMSIMGLTTIKNDDLKKIINCKKERESFKKFRSINYFQFDESYWLFEHRNIQEFLTAEVLLRIPFRNLIEVITVDKNKTILAPRLLNSVSFLFEIIKVDSKLFRDLLEWFVENEPEFILRFEKERLSYDKRLEIFFKIWDRYKNVKKITLRASKYLTLRELADFIEIRKQTIEFLLNELVGYLEEGLAYDALDLIGKAKKPFIVEEKVKEILLPLLSDDKYSDFIHAKIVETFINLGLLNKNDFKAILENIYNKDGFEFRLASVRFLLRTPFYNEFSGFILSCIPIYNKGQEEISLGGVNELLRGLISRFNKQRSILELIKLLRVKTDLLEETGMYRFCLGIESFAKVLNSASALGGSNSSICKAVYELLKGLKYYWWNNSQMKPFVLYFSELSIRYKVFVSLYKETKNIIPCIHFIDDKSCDFLIEEYLSGNISEKQLNNFLHYTRDLYPEQVPYFEGKIKELCENVEIINHPAYLQKVEEEIVLINNQILKSNKSVLINEMRRIFNLVGQTKVKANDLFFSKVADYKSSMGFQAIVKKCRMKREGVTLDYLISKYTDQEFEWFKIITIKNMLQIPNDKEKIDGETLKGIKTWCKTYVDKLDFTDTYKDLPNGRISIKGKEALIIELVCLLDIELTEKLWLKLLVADGSGYFHSKFQISEKIVKNVTDPKVLKKYILFNIRELQLAQNVLLNHFKLCGDLNITDALPDLYRAITANNKLQDIDRINLIKTFIGLGGSLDDFELLVQELYEMKSQEIISSWQWYLMLEHKKHYPIRIKPILIDIFNNVETSVVLKKLVAKELISFGYIESLYFWSQQLFIERKSFVDSKNILISKGIQEMPKHDVITLLLTTLKKVYEKGVHEELIWPNSIEDIIFDWLQEVIGNNESIFLKIFQTLKNMAIAFDNSKHVELSSKIRYRNELLQQNFYNSKTVEIKANDASILFEYIKSVSSVE